MDVTNQTKTKYDDDIFKIPFDKVRLPSEGKLYSGIPDVVEVEYLTTEDEDTLYSNTLMDNGKVFNVLVETKLKDKNINVNDLLIGDFNQILVFLRKSAYGHIYKTKVFDPDLKDFITKEVDLNQLTVKNVGASFNENGEFDFVLPILNKRITFKLLTVGLGDIINTVAESKKDPITGKVPYLTTKFETQIMSVEGDRDKIYISKLVKVLPPMDRLKLGKYIESIEPKVELTYKFKSAIKETEFEESIMLGMDFFYPQNID